MERRESERDVEQGPCRNHQTRGAREGGRAVPPGRISTCSERNLLIIDPVLRCTRLSCNERARMLSCSHRASAVDMHSSHDNPRGTGDKAARGCGGSSTGKAWTGRLERLLVLLHGEEGLLRHSNIDKVKAFYAALILHHTCSALCSFAAKVSLTASSACCH